MELLLIYKEQDDEDCSMLLDYYYDKHTDHSEHSDQDVYYDHSLTKNE